MTDTIITEGNKLNPDSYLELFDFDSSYIGGSILYFTNTPTGGGVLPLIWRTNSYYPAPFEVTGIDSRGDGTAPNRPQLSVSNLNKFFLAAVNVVGNLEGMQITRWRTYFKFTDAGSLPNINMHYPTDTWVITRKVSGSKQGLQYEMSSPLDRPGLKLPRKQILRDPGVLTPNFPGVSLVRAR